ncbi:MAG: CBS domain-containing protein [Betaproteobacteria bacterium]|nr:MAG: CBS domain-containing protein [Betaproteobacteria bacterium]
MKAKDVMTQDVVSVREDASVESIARLLLQRRISAVPVTDAAGRPAGIVSEGDLMRRPEAGTERRPSWWLELLQGSDEQAAQYIKSHGLVARDVMTRDPLTVSENTPLEKVASLLEQEHIKRLPVVRGGKMVGIVSRADLLHALVAGATWPAPRTKASPTRKEVVRGIREAGLPLSLVNVVLEGRVVHLWGSVQSKTQRDAIALAARRSPGVRGVKNHLSVLAAVSSTL